MKKIHRQGWFFFYMRCFQRVGVKNIFTSRGEKGKKRGRTGAIQYLCEPVVVAKG
jgi:hypothetical protein